MKLSDQYDYSSGILLNSDIGIVIAVFESGHSVELPATGYSMFPTLRPGDIVTVKPITTGELPVPGEVVVFLTENTLVMHRLVKIVAADSDKPEFITQGDSLSEPDKQRPDKKPVGVAVLYKRNGKEHPVKTRIPHRLSYKFNNRLLWICNRLKKVEELKKTKDKRQK